MNATTVVPVNTQSSQTPVAKGQKQPRTDDLSVVRLDAGESIFLGHPRCPESKMLIQGQHFDWAPPYRGRPGNEWAVMAAEFKAKTPLLLVVRDQDGNWARSVSHMRVARPGKSVAGLPAAYQIVDEYALRRGAKDAAYAEHLVLGGPACAAVYQDEIVVPAYRGHTERALPFAYIVEAKDRDLLMSSFGASVRQERSARSGEAPVVRGIVASGVMRVKTLGAFELRYDRVGRIHGISQTMADGQVKVKTFTKFANGIEVRVGELVTAPRLREALELDLLPVVQEVLADTYKYVPPPRRERQPEGNRVAAATPTAALLDQVRVVPAPPKAVPTAVRRASAPKLADVVAPVEELPAPPEEIDVPAELPVIEAPEPEVDPAPAEVAEETEAPAPEEVEVPAEVEIQPEPEPPAEETVVSSGPVYSVTAELLVEAFAGETLPLLVGDDGLTILAVTGAEMTPWLATTLENHFAAGNSLLMSPALVGFFNKFYDIYVMEHPLPAGDPDALHK